MDLSKHMLFQSVRLVGAVGIEPTSEMSENCAVVSPRHSMSSPKKVHAAKMFRVRWASES